MNIAISSKQVVVKSVENFAPDEDGFVEAFPKPPIVCMSEDYGKPILGFSARLFAKFLILNPNSYILNSLISVILSFFMNSSIPFIMSRQISGLTKFAVPT